MNQQYPADDPRSYLLSKDTYICATHDGVVFLDLCGDRYLGLGGTQAHALSRVLQGWPGHPTFKGELNSEESETYAISVAELLIAEGLLTRDWAVGKSAAPVRLTGRPLVPLGEDVECPRRIRSADTVRALAACMSAAFLLRAHSMVKVVQRVAAHAEKRAGHAAPFDPDHTAELVSIFRRLRMYTFTASGNCLFHSLALRHFLASNGVFPRWVVGIKTNPFAAHSWLQFEHYVMDATPEELGFFTPILVV